VIPLVDIVIVSEEDHPDMYELAKKWTEKDKGIVIITQGEEGAVALKEGKEINLPGRPVKVEDIVDSVGSGDIFSAGFAYKYKQTGDIKEAGKFANELARQCLFYPADKIKIDFKQLPY